MASVTPDGKIRLPADLDSVTAIGDEDHSGIDSAAVDRIWQAARHWYAGGMHPAIQVCLRHNGRVVLNRAIGHGWGNAPTDPPDADKVPVATETPFCVYSAGKGIAATVVHMLVERGVFSLDDRLCEYLPTFTSHGKDRITIRHVMTHSAGLPFPTGPRPDVTRADDHDYACEKLSELRPLHRPGLVHIYHALTWGPLIREVVWRATGKEIREILATEVLDPLGFRWTNFGVAKQDVELVAPSHATGRPLPAVLARIFRKAIGGTVHEIIPYTNTPMFLTTIVPSSNAVSTARRVVAVRRNMAPRRRTRRRQGDQPRRPCAARCGSAAVAARRRGRADARPLGHRLHARHGAVRAVRAPRAGGVRQPGPGQHRDLGRPAAQPRRRRHQQRQARARPASQALHRADGHDRRADPRRLTPRGEGDRSY